MPPDYPSKSMLHMLGVSTWYRWFVPRQPLSSTIINYNFYYCSAIDNIANFYDNTSNKVQWQLCNSGNTAAGVLTQPIASEASNSSSNEQDNKVDNSISII